MKDRFSESDRRKLAHAYVALALAQDVANGYVSEKPAHAILHPLVTMLDLTAGLLEEVLENNDHERPPNELLTEELSLEEPAASVCSEMLM
jgi:hypothetical protein